jgi:hypothetical protein
MILFVNKNVSLLNLKKVFRVPNFNTCQIYSVSLYSFFLLIRSHEQHSLPCKLSQILILICLVGISEVISRWVLEVVLAMLNPQNGKVSPFPAPLTN